MTIEQEHELLTIFRSIAKSLEKLANPEVSVTYQTYTGTEKTPIPFAPATPAGDGPGLRVCNCTAGRDGQCCQDG